MKYFKQTITLLMSTSNIVIQHKRIFWEVNVFQAMTLKDSGVQTQIQIDYKGYPKNPPVLVEIPGNTIVPHFIVPTSDLTLFTVCQT